MAATEAKRVGVIGAGMVGVCAASWLQRDGYSVFLVEAGSRGMAPPSAMPAASTALR